MGFVHGWLRRTAARCWHVAAPRAAASLFPRQERGRSRGFCERVDQAQATPLDHGPERICRAPEADGLGTDAVAAAHFRQKRAALTCEGAAPARLTFPASRRLRRKPEFDAAFERGRRLGDGFFGVIALPNDKGCPRLGSAVGVRLAGGGVQRNRLRRLIRESFRVSQNKLPAVDLVVSARTRARGAAPTALRASLAELWTKVNEQCAPSPRS